MQFLYKYGQKYWTQFGAAVAFVTLEAICDLLQPTIMSRIIDEGVAGRQMDLVMHMGVLMLCITALGALAATARNIMSSTVSQRLGADLRSELYEKIQSLSFANIDNLDRASLVTRLTNDVTQVQILANGLMRISLKAPLLCIGSLIMATSLNPGLTVVLAIVVPVIGVLIAINMKLGFPLFMKVQTALDRVNSVMREYLAGVRVVKAYNRFCYEVDKFEKANEELQGWSIAAMRRMAVFVPSIMLTMNLGIVAVLWLGGLGVSKGQIQAGQIIAFINYMTQILFSLVIISMMFNMFARAKVSAQRIGEVFLQENTMTWRGSEGNAANSNGRIDFVHVSFSYEGLEPVLKDISLTCMPGQTVGIIGSTGSGKSTLVGLIPRFYDVSAGCVKVGGEDVKDINPRTLREKIAIVPQKTMLFTGTILENIRWGKENATLEEVERAARLAEAHEFIKSFPEGYKTKLGQGGVNLSGGQKQRISIARALVRNPEILILDDCTSAVDVATEARIKESLKKYRAALTCIIISQRLITVMDADKIAVMDGGEIVGMGNHEELIKNCQVYNEILQSQLGKERQ
ncbi:putative ABC transporter ATP-binding protein [Sporomusa carbonis]|uniref:ABC transporter ATP-binding protein n=1 Tax=Sporomusa carbonis TaxID=3076075 RepID=UPI003A614CA1